MEPGDRQLVERIIARARAGTLVERIIARARAGTLVERIIARARAGTLAVIGPGTALIDTTYVDNAAEAITAALDRRTRTGRRS